MVRVEEVTQNEARTDKVRHEKMSDMPKMNDGGGVEPLLNGYIYIYIYTYVCIYVCFMWRRLPALVAGLPMPSPQDHEAFKRRLFPAQ